MNTRFTWLWRNPPSGRASRPLRYLALATTVVFTWTGIMATPVYALTHQPPPMPIPGVRSLTAQEMAHILGSSNPQVALGESGTVPGTDKGPSGVSSWTVYSPSMSTVDTGATSGTTGSHGWTVSWTSGASATVSAPSGATVGGGYSVVWNIGPTGFPPHMEEYGGSFDVVQPGMSENSGSAYPWERMTSLFATGGHPPPGGGVIHKGGSGFIPIKPILVGPTTSAPVLHQANTVNGNKMTVLPLVGWTARGGLPVAFALVHNSQSSHNTILGQKWTHSFDIYGKTDGSGNVTLHWGDDQSYTFTKNMGGSFTAPAGIFDSLVKNGDGTYTLTTHDQVTYQFNTSLQCTSLSDENSNTITLSYTSGVLTSITDPTSRSLTIAYSSGRISTITDPLSRVFTMHYDANGNLSQVDFPALSGTTYSYYLSYNTAHDLTDLETPRGYHWTFNYNSDDSISWAKDPYSNETSTSYTSTTMTVTDPNSHSTVYTYDTSGRITQVKDPLLDHADLSSYTSNNQPQTLADKRGYDWTFTYDSSGNTLTAKDPNSNTTTLTYSSHNWPLTVKLPSLRQIVLTYDTHDNLTQVDHKDSSGTIQATEKYTVNSNGLTTDYYDANSHHYQYGYDTNGDLTSQTTPNSHETQWTYDSLGVIATREDALSRTTTYSPDAWERITTITYPDTSTHTFTFDWTTTSLSLWMPPEPRPEATTMRIGSPGKAKAVRQSLATPMMPPARRDCSPPSPTPTAGSLPSATHPGRNSIRSPKPQVMPPMATTPTEMRPVLPTRTAQR